VRKDAKVSVTVQVSHSAQPQARRLLLVGSIFALLLHSALASRALFWLFRISQVADARLLRLRYAADLNRYHDVYICYKL